MKKCLFVNPMSNGKVLANYFKERGCDVYAFVEIKKLREQKGEITDDDVNRFDPDFYQDVYVNQERVFESGVQFDCIIPGSEMGVEAAEFLISKYGLDGNKYETLAYRRDKFEMQEQLRRNNLPYAKSVMIDLSVDRPLTEDKLNDFSFPVVLKPLGGAGMEDVFFCDTLEEVNARLNSIEYGKLNCMLVENTHFVLQEFLVGEEFALDYVVHKNKPYICVVSKYLKNFKVDNKYITTESVFYSPDDPKYASLIEYGRQVLNALELTDGPVHIEFISNGDRHCLIDVGARMRGGGDTWFYSEIYTIGLLEAIYDKYVNDGRNLRDSVLVKHGIHTALNASISGCFRGLSVEEEEKLAQLPMLKELTLKLRKNKEYRKTNNLASSAGVATIIGDDMTEVNRTGREIFLILENHLGDWYRNIPSEIESCNEVEVTLE